MHIINPALLNQKNREIFKVILEAQESNDPSERRQRLRDAGYSECDIEDFFTMLERHTHELASDA
jgi:hypothetical protein